MWRNLLKDLAFLQVWIVTCDQTGGAVLRTLSWLAEPQPLFCRLEAQQFLPGQGHMAFLPSTSFGQSAEAMLKYIKYMHGIIRKAKYFENH